MQELRDGYLSFHYIKDQRVESIQAIGRNSARLYPNFGFPGKNKPVKVL